MSNQTHIFFQQRCADHQERGVQSEKSPVEGVGPPGDQCNFPLTAGIASPRAGDARNVSSKRLPVREIVFVHCCVNRIIPLDSGRDLVSGLAQGRGTVLQHLQRGQRRAVGSRVVHDTTVPSSAVHLERGLFTPAGGGAPNPVTSLRPQATASGVNPQALRSCRPPSTGRPCAGRTSHGSGRSTASAEGSS